MAPENQCSTLILRISKDFMKLNRKSVEVTDMERAKVGVEGVV